MADIGTDGEEINASQMKLYIGSTSNQWRLLQNVRVLNSHPIFREPTTDGGVKLYTGAFDGNISGTLLFTRDSWDNGTSNDFHSLLTKTNGEVPTNSWLVKFVDVSGGTAEGEWTYENVKLSVVDISKSVEGAVKVDITLVLPSLPTVGP